MAPRCRPTFVVSRAGSFDGSGDGRSPANVTVATEWNWTAFSLLIRQPRADFEVEASAVDQLRDTHVRFENVGSAPCYVGRLRYDTLANVCVSRECVDEAASSRDATSEVITDARFDVGDVGEDSARDDGARDSGADREDVVADRGGRDG